MVKFFLLEVGQDMFEKSKLSLIKKKHTSVTNCIQNKIMQKLRENMDFPLYDLNMMGFLSIPLLSSILL
jgi:hypothetical protein